MDNSKNKLPSIDIFQATFSNKDSAIIQDFLNYQKSLKNSVKETPRNDIAECTACNKQFKHVKNLQKHKCTKNSFTTRTASETKKDQIPLITVESDSDSNNSFTCVEHLDTHLARSSNSESFSTIESTEIINCEVVQKSRRSSSIAGNYQLAEDDNSSECVFLDLDSTSDDNEATISECEDICSDEFPVANVIDESNGINIYEFEEESSNSTTDDERDSILSITKDEPTDERLSDEETGLTKHQDGVEHKHGIDAENENINSSKDWNYDQFPTSEKYIFVENGCSTADIDSDHLLPDHLEQNNVESITTSDSCCEIPLQDLDDRGGVEIRNCAKDYAPFNDNESSMISLKNTQVEVPVIASETNIATELNSCRRDNTTSETNCFTKDAIVPVCRDVKVVLTRISTEELRLSQSDCRSRISKRYEDGNQSGIPKGCAQQQKLFSVERKGLNPCPKCRRRFRYFKCYQRHVHACGAPCEQNDDQPLTRKLKVGSEHLKQKSDKLKKLQITKNSVENLNIELSVANVEGKKNSIELQGESSDSDITAGEQGSTLSITRDEPDDERLSDEETDERLSDEETDERLSDEETDERLTHEETGPTEHQDGVDHERGIDADGIDDENENISSSKERNHDQSPTSEKDVCVENKCSTADIHSDPLLSENLDQNDVQYATASDSSCEFPLRGLDDRDVVDIRNCAEDYIPFNNNESSVINLEDVQVEAEGVPETASHTNIATELDSCQSKKTTSGTNCFTKDPIVPVCRDIRVVLTRISADELLLLQSDCRSRISNRYEDGNQSSIAEEYTKQQTVSSFLQLKKFQITRNSVENLNNELLVPNFEDEENSIDIVKLEEFQDMSSDSDTTANEHDSILSITRDEPADERLSDEETGPTEHEDGVELKHGIDAENVKENESISSSNERNRDQFPTSEKVVFVGNECSTAVINSDILLSENLDQTDVQYVTASDSSCEIPLQGLDDRGVVEIRNCAEDYAPFNDNESSMISFEDAQVEAEGVPVTAVGTDIANALDSCQSKKTTSKTNCFTKDPIVPLCRDVKIVLSRISADELLLFQSDCSSKSSKRDEDKSNKNTCSALEVNITCKYCTVEFCGIASFRNHYNNCTKTVPSKSIKTFESHIDNLSACEAALLEINKTCVRHLEETMPASRMISDSIHTPFTDLKYMYTEAKTECVLCGMVLVSHMQLIRHFRTHADCESPHLDIITRGFSQNRKAVCFLCARSDRRTSQLSQHMHFHFHQLTVDMDVKDMNFEVALSLSSERASSSSWKECYNAWIRLCVLRQNLMKLKLSFSDILSACEPAYYPIVPWSEKGMDSAILRFGFMFQLFQESKCYLEKVQELINKDKRKQLENCSLDLSVSNGNESADVEFSDESDVNAGYISSQSPRSEEMDEEHTSNHNNINPEDNLYTEVPHNRSEESELMTNSYKDKANLKRGKWEPENTKQPSEGEPSHSLRNLRKSADISDGGQETDIIDASEEMPLPDDLDSGDDDESGVIEDNWKSSNSKDLQKKSCSKESLNQEELAKSMGIKLLPRQCLVLGNGSEVIGIENVLSPGKKVSCRLGKHSSRKCVSNCVEKLFQCIKCKERVKSKLILKQHFQRHSVRSVACSDCPRQFHFVSQLRRHKKRFHFQENEENKCSICGEMFNLKNKLLMHQAKSHNVLDKTIQQCNYCGRYVFAKDYTRHLKKHQRSKKKRKSLAPISDVKLNSSVAVVKKKSRDKVENEGFEIDGRCEAKNCHRDNPHDTEEQVENGEYHTENIDLEPVSMDQEPQTKASQNCKQSSDDGSRSSVGSVIINCKNCDGQFDDILAFRNHYDKCNRSMPDTSDELGNPAADNLYVWEMVLLEINKICKDQLDEALSASKVLNEMVSVPVIDMNNMYTPFHAECALCGLIANNHFQLRNHFYRHVYHESPHLRNVDSPKGNVLNLQCLLCTSKHTNKKYFRKHVHHHMRTLTSELDISDINFELTLQSEKASASYWNECLNAWIQLFVMRQTLTKHKYLITEIVSSCASDYQPIIPWSEDSMDSAVLRFVFMFHLFEESNFYLKKVQDGISLITLKSFGGVQISLELPSSEIGINDEDNSNTKQLTTPSYSLRYRNKCRAPMRYAEISDDDDEATHVIETIEEEWKPQPVRSDCDDDGSDVIEVIANNWSLKKALTGELQKVTLQKEDLNLDISKSPELLPNQRVVIGFNNKVIGIENVLRPGEKVKCQLLTHSTKCRYCVEKLFQCIVCKGNVSSKKGLIRHFQRHLEKHISCPECKCRFTFTYDLKEHQKAFHFQAGETNKCSVCEKIFSRKNKLRTHEFKVHSIRDKTARQCGICGRYCQAHYYGKHLKLHKKWKTTKSIRHSIAGKSHKQKTPLQLQKDNVDLLDTKCASNLIDGNFKEKHLFSQDVTLQDSNDIDGVESTTDGENESGEGNSTVHPSENVKKKRLQLKKEVSQNGDKSVRIYPTDSFVLLTFTCEYCNGQYFGITIFRKHISDCASNLLGIPVSKLKGKAENLFASEAALLDIINICEKQMQEAMSASKMLNGMVCIPFSEMKNMCAQVKTECVLCGQFILSNGTGHKHWRYHAEAESPHLGIIQRSIVKNYRAVACLLCRKLFVRPSQLRSHMHNHIHHLAFGLTVTDTNFQVNMQSENACSIYWNECFYTWIRLFVTRRTLRNLKFKFNKILSSCESDYLPIMPWSEKEMESEIIRFLFMLQLFQESRLYLSMVQEVIRKDGLSELDPVVKSSVDPSGMQTEEKEISEVLYEIVSKITDVEFKPSLSTCATFSDIEQMNPDHPSRESKVKESSIEDIDEDSQKCCGAFVESGDHLKRTKKRKCSSVAERNEKSSKPDHTEEAFTNISSYSLRKRRKSMWNADSLNEGEGGDSPKGSEEEWKPRESKLTSKAKHTKIQSQSHSLNEEDLAKSLGIELLPNERLMFLNGTGSEVIGIKSISVEKNASELPTHSRKCVSNRPEKLFQCIKCMSKFVSEIILQQHFRKHSNKRLPCPECKLRFHSISDLSKHKRQCHFLVGESNKCSSCGEIFSRKDKLIVHQLKAHNIPDKTHSLCKQCGKFIHRKNYRKHLNEHRGIKKSGLFLCSVCGKEFSNKFYLQFHEDGVHNLCKEDHPCRICGNIFPSVKRLKLHLYIHKLKEEKRYKCSLCDKVFQSPFFKQRHELTHSGEQPFRCDECGMNFNQKNSLVRHMRVHTGSKPYQCSGCERYFSQMVGKHCSTCTNRLKKRQPTKCDSDEDL